VCDIPIDIPCSRYVVDEGSFEQAITSPQTMDEHQFVNPYQATIVKTDVTRALPSLIPEVFDEMMLVMEENLKITDGSGMFCIHSFP
jgi:hypothetical protein